MDVRSCWNAGATSREANVRDKRILISGMRALPSAP